MEHVKRFFSSPFKLIFSTQKTPAALGLPPVKLQKRCVELTSKEKDFVHAQVHIAQNPLLKELFLCHARGTIFSKPGSVTYAVYR